ncbi:MAG: hypothetical protein PUJ57_04500 [Peptoniphilaceae bacterium]|nr:hypothetical protein [Peptoniphilaceae bacterium]MDY6085374.1 hypothetical protein [Peptoniphilaceae bacterium]
MQCDFCPNEATIEIVILVNGEAQKVRMCASCYQEKLQEMMGALPQKWGGKELTDQIRTMLEKAQEDGTLYQGVEFNFIAPDAPVPEEAEDEDEDEEAEDEDAVMIDAEKLFRQMQMHLDLHPFGERHHEAHAKRDEGKSARELAFDQQRKSLLSQRTQLIQKMQIALNEEDYEKCAHYRDDLDRIGDALIQLNEERKDPHGV